MSIKVDWGSAPDDATHALTTGSKWDGAPSLKDKVRFVRRENGEYCDGYGSCSVSYPMDCYGWVVLEERPEHPQTNQAHPKQEIGAHYNNYVTIELTDDELISGKVTLKIDPHFVSLALKMQGGPMEHIFKKAMRSSSKGHSQIEVYEEIKKLCERGIELEELLK